MRRTLFALTLLTLPWGCSSSDRGERSSSPGPDAAEAVAPAAPAELNCGDLRELSLTFHNVGTTEWTAAGGYDVRAAGADAFAAVPVVALGEEDAIPPGGTLMLVLPIRAPGNAGVHASEWRMAKDATPFGAAAAWSIEIFCNRTPDPAPGEALPLPYLFDLVQQVADEDPTLIAESCQNAGGNWRFLDTVVDRLRRVDTRWGYNWKRGVVGDPSHDVVDYHYGSGPDEGSQNVYIIDILADHCGTNPYPAWTDVTQATLDGGTIGVWTSLGRFDLPPTVP